MAGNADVINDIGVQVVLPLRLPLLPLLLPLLVLALTSFFASVSQVELPLSKLRGPADPKLAAAQWRWLEGRINSSTADYLWVGGHYPIWAIGNDPPTGIQKKLRPLLNKYVLLLLLAVAVLLLVLLVLVVLVLVVLVVVLAVLVLVLILVVRISSGTRRTTSMATSTTWSTSSRTTPRSTTSALARAGPAATPPTTWTRCRAARSSFRCPAARRTTSFTRCG